MVLRSAWYAIRILELTLGMSHHQEVLAQTLSEYVSQSASETESVQIAAIDLNTGELACAFAMRSLGLA